MAKHIRSVHTLDLNHPPSVDRFLDFLKEHPAKVLAYSKVDSSNSIRSVMTIYRAKEKK